LEFSELGFDKILPVSAIHGDGIEPLMDAAAALLPVTTADQASALAPPPSPPAQ
jgi:predicted GTPase